MLMPHNCLCLTLGIAKTYIHECMLVLVFQQLVCCQYPSATKLMTNIAASANQLVHH